MFLTITFSNAINLMSILFYLLLTYLNYNWYIKRTKELKLDARGLIKLRALELRNYSENKRKFFTKEQKRAFNVIIHFDDDLDSRNQPFPSWATELVGKAHEHYIYRKVH